MRADLPPFIRYLYNKLCMNIACPPQIIYIFYFFLYPKEKSNKKFILYFSIQERWVNDRVVFLIWMNARRPEQFSRVVIIKFRLFRMPPITDTEYGA
jgi:hypothetical protein